MHAFRIIIIITFSCKIDLYNYYIIFVIVLIDYSQDVH